MVLHAFIFMVTSSKRSDAIAMDVRHRTKQDQKKKEKPRYVSQSKAEPHWHPGAAGRVPRPGNGREHEVACNFIYYSVKTNPSSSPPLCVVPGTQVPLKERMRRGIAEEEKLHGQSRAGGNPASITEHRDHPPGAWWAARPLRARPGAAGGGPGPPSPLRSRPPL